MTWFQAFRGGYGFTYYNENRTPASIDVSLAIVVYAIILVSIATLIAAAGVRGKERRYTVFRVVYSLTVGATIMFGLFGYCWLQGDTKVTAPYIYRSGAEVEGTLGLTIGLSKVNITLRSNFVGGKGDVNYNEEIEFDGLFVPKEELKHFLIRGLPDPIISIVEYFATDEGDLRWGRGFTTAGYLARILLWASFAFWVLSNIMISSVVFYGAALYTLTGITMLLTVITYHVSLPSRRLKLFHSHEEMAIIYGACFWLVLLFGIITTISGVCLLVFDYHSPKRMAKYFLFETPINDDIYEPLGEVRRISSAACYQQKQMDLKRRFSLPTLSHQMGAGKGSCESGDTFRVNPIYNNQKQSSPANQSPTFSNLNKQSNLHNSFKEGHKLSVPQNPETTFQIGGDSLTIENEMMSRLSASSTRTLESIDENEDVHDNIGYASDSDHSVKEQHS